MTNTGDGYNYYFCLNRKSNANLDAVESIDEVLVMKRLVGSDYEDSSLSSRIPSAGFINIYYIERNSDVIVYVSMHAENNLINAVVQSVETSTDKRLCVTNEQCNDFNSRTEGKCYTGDFCPEFDWHRYCTFTPLPYDNCGKNVQVKLTTNKFPQHIDWRIKNIETGRVLLVSGLY